jgi:hypothetical protein
MYKKGQCIRGAADCRAASSRMHIMACRPDSLPRAAAPGQRPATGTPRLPGPGRGPQDAEITDASQPPASRGPATGIHLLGLSPANDDDY